MCLSMLALTRDARPDADELFKGFLHSLPRVN